jgi:hypothetical protein
MEQNRTGQILERLLAEMKTQFDFLATKMDANEAKRRAHHEEMMAMMKAWHGGVMHACLEEEEGPTPEETEAVAEPQEVPEGGTGEETFGATEDRAGEQRLAVRCHGQLKKRAQGNGGLQQKLAAARGRFIHCAVPALRKGHVHKVPGRTLGSRIKNRGLKQHQTEDSAVRGTPKGRTCEKRWWTQPNATVG